MGVLRWTNWTARLVLIMPCMCRHFRHACVVIPTLQLLCLLPCICCHSCHPFAITCGRLGRNPCLEFYLGMHVCVFLFVFAYMCLQGRTALHLAVSCKAYAAVSELVTLGADICAAPPGSLTTPLTLACQQLDARMVTELLSSTAAFDVNTVDGSGSSALGLVYQTLVTAVVQEQRQVGVASVDSAHIPVCTNSRHTYTRVRRHMQCQYRASSSSTGSQIAMNVHRSMCHVLLRGPRSMSPLTAPYNAVLVFALLCPLRTFASCQLPWKASAT